jgi:hypothetical protein
MMAITPGAREGLSFLACLAKVFLVWRFTGASMVGTLFVSFFTRTILNISQTVSSLIALIPYDKYYATPPVTSVADLDP